MYYMYVYVQAIPTYRVYRLYDYDTVESGHSIRQLPSLSSNSILKKHPLLYYGHEMLAHK